VERIGDRLGALGVACAGHAADVDEAAFEGLE
jgi:hypothetical protein